MRLSPGKRSRRTQLISLLLVAFALRALIPPGFMPSSDRPFTLEICWEGLPAAMLAQSEPREPGEHHHHHPSGSPAHSEHCVFGTACGAGPIPHLSLPSALASAQELRAVDFRSAALPVRLVHLPQARAPPARVS
jgi:hypothetical protein